MWGAKKKPCNCESHEKALDELRREQKTLALEWENTLDKLGKIVGRLNARARALVQDAPDPEARAGDRSPDAPPPAFDYVAARRRQRAGL